MIAHLEGRALSVGADWVVVQVQGVGYLVGVPARVLEEIRVGAPVALHVHTHVREDQITLYGFPTHAELELFRQLMAVDGIGPRSAQQILSATRPDTLRRAILADDQKLLRTMPGVGPKTAARMVLELRARLGEGAAAPELPAQPVAGTAVEVLVGMGFSQGEAREALARLDGELDGLDPAEAVAQALRQLDRR
ncbi:MAG: Holliday junction branch migration protein RuvA [Candidatus Dormibacteria bacterium]